MDPITLHHQHRCGAVSNFNRLDDMEILDKWTNFSLEAYWKQIVRDCQEANATGKTPPPSPTVPTRNLPFSKNRISI
jgi:hypothetical protein